MSKRWHCPVKAMHEICEVHLAFRAEVCIGDWHCLAIVLERECCVTRKAAGLVVTWASHIGLTGGNGGELVVESFQD